MKVPHKTLIHAAATPEHTTQCLEAIYFDIQDCLICLKGLQKLHINF